MGELGWGLPYSHPAGLEERSERVQAALVDVGPSVRVSFSQYSVFIYILKF